MIALVLAVVALVLGLVDVIRSRGLSLVGWAVIALAVIHLLPRL